MKRWIVAMSSLTAAMVASVGSASALECDGLEVPDSFAVEVLNAEVAGESKKLNKRKTLVVNSVQSVSGTECNFRMTLDVTLKRKIRQDAHGTADLKGSLSVENGQICLGNLQVEDVDVSHTAEIGEAVYEWVADRALPDQICF